MKAAERIEVRREAPQSYVAALFDAKGRIATARAPTPTGAWRRAFTLARPTPPKGGQQR